jgi:serine/threonine protein kinase
MVDFSNLMRERMINWPASLARYRAGYYFVPEQVFAVQMDAILDSTTLQNVIESLIVSPNIWARWMRNVITALAFLHQNGFIHRDAHSGNVMVPLNIDSPDSNAVLIDLDLACATNSDCVSQCLGPATPRSTPPDLWCESFLKPTPLPAQWQAGDIWAAAATFASCVARKNNFIALQLNYSSNRSNMTIENRQTECTAAKNVLNYNRVINDALLLLGQNSELYRLLKQMLEIEWSARPSASDCLARLDNLRQSLDTWSGSGDSIVSRASTDGSLASSDATVVDSYF